MKKLFAIVIIALCSCGPKSLSEIENVDNPLSFRFINSYKTISSTNFRDCYNIGLHIYNRTNATIESVSGDVVFYYKKKFVDKVFLMNVTNGKKMAPQSGQIWSYDAMEGTGLYDLFEKEQNVTDKDFSYDIIVTSIRYKGID